jgi:hypothetical protein
MFLYLELIAYKINFYLLKYSTVIEYCYFFNEVENKIFLCNDNISNYYEYVPTRIIFQLFHYLSIFSISVKLMSHPLDL